MTTHTYGLHCNKLHGSELVESRILSQYFETLEKYLDFSFTKENNSKEIYDTPPPLAIQQMTDDWNGFRITSNNEEMVKWYCQSHLDASPDVVSTYQNAWKARLEPEFQLHFQQIKAAKLTAQAVLISFVHLLIFLFV